MASSKSELILHIGVPKTGTTAIQRSLYQNRNQLEEQGVFYPETFLDAFPVEDQWAHHLYAHKWGGWLDARKFNISPDAAWHSLREKVESEPGRYIVSSERFADLLSTSRSRDVLDFITSLFSGTEVKVVGYIRRQDILAESFLKQRVKVGVQDKGLEDYIADLPSFLDYNLMFSNISEFVGWQNVVIRLYDRRNLFKEDVTLDFLDFLRVDADSLANTNGAVANESMGALTAMIFLEFIKNNTLNDVSEVKSFVKRYLQSDEFKIWNEATILDEKTRVAVLSRYKEGNLQLSKKISNPSAIFLLLEQVHEFPRHLAEDQPVFSGKQFCNFVESIQDILTSKR